jgi:prevent-host-death family protein
MKHWQLQEAKARLSELVKLAAARGPQEITVHGKPAVVVVSKSEFERMKTRKQRFVDFINTSPLKGLSVDITRNRSHTRNFEL